MSQMDGETKTIDGEEFKVLMLDPLTANDLLVDITKVVGPAIASILASVLKSSNSQETLDQLLDGIKKKHNSDNEIPEDLLGDNIERSIIGLIDKIDKDKLREIIKTMESVTSVRKGNNWPSLSSIFQILFRGKIKLMYRWLAFALRVQFQDFF